MKCTVVFEKNWDAINCDLLRDEDGNLILDDEGSPQRAIRYIINEGSSRSSKTYSLIDCFDLYGRENENKRMTVWRDTKTDCKSTVLNDTLKHLKTTDRYEVDQSFNKTESTFSYDTQSTWEIMGTDELNKVMGLGQDAAWMNEPYKIPKAVFDQIDQRTRDFIVIDWNPKESHWIDDLKKNKRAITIKSTFRDNPFCPPEQRAKILSYQPVARCAIVESKALTADQARQYNLAENPLKFSYKQIKELFRCKENEHQNSADEFNWSVYGLGEKAERPNRIFHFHEIPDSVYFDLEETEYHAVDWGAVDPWGILGAKYYDGALYLHEKNYECENVVRKKLGLTEKAQIEGEDEGLVSFMFRKLNISTESIVVCDSNRKLKILALRDSGWEYALAAKKGPGSIKDTTDLLNGMKVYYTKSSENLKYEQENHSRQVDRYGIVLDEPEEDNNHLLDPARYIAQYLQDEGIIKNI